MTLIVALDRVSLQEAEQLVGDLCDVVEGFKVGLPFVLSAGVKAVEKLRGACPSRLWIADYKLADIGYIMRLIAEEAASWADAVIAHSFVGVDGGLGELAEHLAREGKKLILVVSMSHPGSRDVYDRAAPYIAAVVDRLKPWGLVAPATRPEMIALYRRRAPWAKILAPGVGAQGAGPGEALCAGADYEIIGRQVTGAPEPRAAALLARRRQEERLRLCRAQS